MRHLDTGPLRERVLDWLEASMLSPEQLRAFAKRPSPASELGLITREAGGVRANLSAFWWTSEGPFFSIAVLALLHVPLHNSAEVVAWIKRQQHPDGHFPKGRLGITVREATYAACVLLRLLGAERDEDGWDRARLIALLRAQQRPGERRHVAFLPHDLKARYAELEVVNCWAGSLAALGEPAADSGAAIRYLQAKQDPAGDFKLGWFKKVPYGPESAARDAVRSLALLGAGPRDPEAALGYLSSKWDPGRAGFAGSRDWYDYGYPRITYWGLLALALLGGLQPPPAPEPALRTLALLSFPTA